MKKRFLSLCMAVVLLLSVCALPAMAADGGLTVRPTTPSAALIEQLTQNDAQRMSAAQEDPEEIVDIFVELKDVPLADRPVVAFSANAVASVQKQLSSAQSTVQTRISRALPKEHVEYTYSYTVLFNGFSVRTARKNLETIRKQSGVSRAFIGGSYSLPANEESQQDLQTALTAASSKFTGKGMTIAVVDTGLDIAHPAFSTEPEGAKFSKDYVRGVLQGADLNAEQMMPGLTADDVYHNAKVPFAFDYYGKDAQVAPTNKWQAANLEHGTHVAGIAAGYEADGEGKVLFSGAAPDAQVIPMKVFDDDGTGASTATVLAALEDAYLLGVDAVNLSLGSSNGFTVDSEELVNEVYNKLDDAGIMVIVAAGNDTSSTNYNNFGNLPLTDDPDNGIVASPSTYPANLSIASVENDLVYNNYFLLGDEKIPYTDSQTSFLGLDSFVEELKMYESIPDDIAAPYDYVIVPGYGQDSDYEGIDVKGKIAVVQRGGTDESGEPITFVTKIQNALWKDAIGIVIYNNDAANPDDAAIVMQTNYYQLPACFVSYNNGQKLIEKAGTGAGITGSMELISSANPAAGQMSSFTSIGTTPDLRIKPELSALGGNIYSSIPTAEGKGKYASMSGTSMASPYVAGASVLVKSYISENWSGSFDAASMTENLMMSTATPVIDPATGLPYTPRLQGSGLVNVNAATSGNVVLYTDADEYGDTKPVLNLGDDAAKTGSYDLTFWAKNFGKDAAEYDISVIAMAPSVAKDETHALMSGKDEAVAFTASGDTAVALDASGVKQVKVSIALTAEQKAKLDASFANGIYVEGYVVLTPKNGAGAELSIPFLAFYGDWSVPGMLDYATMLNEGTTEYSLMPSELGTYFTPSFAYRLGANLSVTTDEAPLTSLKAEHMTISPNGDTYMDGVELTNVSQLRSASALHFAATDAEGNILWTDTSYGVPKTSYNASAGMAVCGTMYNEFAPEAWYGTDNEGKALPDGQYYYTVTVDPMTDHGTANVRNTLTFPVYIDTQAPVLESGRVVLYRNDEGRLILGMPIHDEHILLAANLFVAEDDGTIGSYSEQLLRKNLALGDAADVQDYYLEADVTDYAGKLLYLQINDWGYNFGAYLISVPKEDLTQQLSMSDENLFLFTGDSAQLYAYDTQKEQPDGLTWSSSKKEVATVDANGSVTAVAPGVAVITASDGKASASCVVGVSDPLTYTGLRLDYDRFPTTIYFDSTIDLPGVYLEPYGFALSGKLNYGGIEGLTWSVDDPTIAHVGTSSWDKTTLYANKEGKTGDVTVTATYQGMTASFTAHVGPYPGSVELYHGWIQARSNRVFLQGKQGVVGAGRDGIHATDTAATSDDQIITFTNANPDVVDLTNPVIRATSNRDLADECAFVDAKNPGIAIITATATSTTQDTADVSVIVVPKQYDGIEAKETSIHMNLGEQADASEHLNLLDAAGIVMAEYNPVNYASLDESVATVDASGKITAVHTGTGLIRALLNTGDYALITVEVTCEHKNTKTETVPATCEEAGSKTITCEDCGEVLSTEVLPAAGHKEVLRNAKDATCTEDGYTGDTYCSVCEKLLHEGSVIPATGHSFGEWTVSKEATCEAAGVEARSCADCGKTETRELPALGHKLTHHEAKAATNKAAGNKEYWSCDACGKLFADAEGKTETTERAVTIAKLAPNTPATGDESTMSLWLMLLAFSAAAAAAVLLLYRKKTTR